MSDKIIQLNEQAIKTELKQLVQSCVEETLNTLLDKEADELLNAGKYECTGGRQGYRFSHYQMTLTNTSSDMALKVLNLEGGIDETLTYMSFPYEYWSRIRTNNTIERQNREIKEGTKFVGTFPDGNSALMLVCAGLRHVVNSQWV